MRAQDREPSPKGAYVLLIQISNRLEGALRGQAFVLEPGLYAYCGSARGPGGLRARIERHRRQDKKVHWHIDQVTTRAPVIAVGTSASLSECALVTCLLKEPGCSIPVAGFGASDCKTCGAHFLKLESGEAFASLGLDLFEA